MKLIKELWTIAGLCEPVPTIMFLTSTNWRELAAEVLKVQPGLPEAPTPKNFRELIVGCLTVVNSGSEDQDAVDEANVQAAQQANFAKKRDALIVGRGPHDPRISTKADNPFPRDGSESIIGDWGG